LRLRRANGALPDGLSIFSRANRRRRTQAGNGPVLAFTWLLSTAPKASRRRSEPIPSDQYTPASIAGCDYPWSIQEASNDIIGDD